MRDTLIKGAFVGYAGLSPVVMVLAVVFTAVLIFGIGIAVDCVRAKLFSRLGVNALCEKVGAALDSWLPTNVIHEEEAHVE